ncbi:TlyA family RNA methyltransferase [bacterium]|nr:TlyA family RNA methyltransferase [bacterium]
MASPKQRIDKLVVEAGLASCEKKAQALIMAGEVLVNEVPVDKAGTFVDCHAQIRLRNQPLKYVSRGGDKLEAALQHFQINVHGKICLDIGSSTGGFTDCLLQHGASFVYALDVGKHQLVDRIRNDIRVCAREEFHVKDLTDQLFSSGPPTLVVVDLSFISLRQTLSFIFNALERVEAKILALVKPQFELGPEYIEKGGVVKDPAHQLLATRLVSDYVHALGKTCSPAFASPVKGQKSGNQEYFILIQSFPGAFL